MNEERQRIYEAILREEEERGNQKKKKKKRILRFCQGCYDRVGSSYADYRVKCPWCDKRMREATPREAREYKKYKKMYAKEDADHREREARWKKRKKLGM